MEKILATIISHGVFVISTAADTPPCDNRQSVMGKVSFYIYAAIVGMAVAMVVWMYMHPTSRYGLKFPGGYRTAFPVLH